jgi:predicted dehydrogenase
MVGRNSGLCPSLGREADRSRLELRLFKVAALTVRKGEKMVLTRRRFFYTGSAAALAVHATILRRPALAQAAALAASDRVRFALIGSGLRGCQHLMYSLTIPGVECVAVSDLYEGRQQAAREYLKKDVPVTRDYRSILDRKDVDAILVATPDHQHSRIVEDACAAGKDVYCEKPLTHKVEEGFSIIDATQGNMRIVQAGAQRVSSILFAKGKEIYDSGRLGKVYAIEGYTDRNSPGGAWEYPIPPDASEATIDWNTFLAGAPKRPFDTARFFRWRCFTDYGEGLGGDLFVHLISGIQYITGVNMPPLRAQTTGGIFRWNDGREFPDLMETLYDYPDFRVSIRCNQNNDAGESTIFYGTKGTLTLATTTLTFQPQNVTEQPQTYAMIGWPAKLRNEYLAEWNKEHPQTPVLSASLNATAESFSVPPQYADTADHQANFFQAVRTRKTPVEDAVFGNNAAISCHMANASYFNNSQVIWDAKEKRIKA